jgi:hypothetical protein
MRIFTYTIAALLTLGCAASPLATEPGPLVPAAGPAGERARTPSESLANEQARHAEASSLCSMIREGVRVSVEDVHEGVALVFTTSGDVAELRERVRDLVEMHERHHPRGAPHAYAMSEGAMGSGTTGNGTQRGSTMRGGMMGGGAPMPQVMMATQARAEDVDRGMRLVLSPDDRAALAELRRGAHDHVARMNQGQCRLTPSASETPAATTPPHTQHHPQ